MLDWGEGADQRFDVPGYYTMTAEIWTNADWFTYQISIYVAAAEGAEDCESCVEDCGACEYAEL